MRILRGGIQAVALLSILALVTACNDDDSNADPDSAGATSTGPEITLTRPSSPLEVSVAQLSPGLKADERAAIVTAVSEPLATWINGAYLDAAYPTTDFSAGFDSWTPAAAQLATRDKDTTTNATIGDSSVAVVADKQQAKLYVFGENGETGGATAKVFLKLTAERDDSSLAHVIVRGDVYLTRAGNTWSIFGYDLTRTGGAA